MCIRDSYIGTEHILLGLVRENEGVAARILLDFDADAEKIRNEIIRMLSGPQLRPHEADVRYQQAFAETLISGGSFGYAQVPQAELTAESRPIPANEPMLLRGILVGWTLFGLASGIGLLVGWLIWG